MEVDPVSIFYWKSPHQISTIVRFLLVNRIQSTNQISLEGLLLTVSVIPNDLLQCTTIKHGSRSRIIQLQILIEIKKKSKTVWYITIYFIWRGMAWFHRNFNFFCFINKLQNSKHHKLSCKCNRHFKLFFILYLDLLYFKSKCSKNIKERLLEKELLNAKRLLI